jgi:hypothetical protein
MKCLKRDCDEGMRFSTHFLVIGHILIWQGCCVLQVLHFFFLFIAIHNFLTLKCCGGLDMLMMKIIGIIIINHVVPLQPSLDLEALLPLF